MDSPQNLPRRRGGDDPLEREIQYVKGVGPYRYTLLKKLGLNNVRDVLFYFPRRFEDRTAFTRLIDLKPAERATAIGRLIDLRTHPLRGGRTLVKGLLSDGTAQRPVIWFSDYVLQFLKSGYQVALTGPVKLSRGVVQFEHPREIEVIDRMPAPPPGPGGRSGPPGMPAPAEDPIEALHARTPPPLRPDMRQAPLSFGRLVPFYGLTEGVNQKLLRGVAYECLRHFAVSIPETVPEEILTRRNLMTVSRAACHMHFPDTLKTHAAAMRRFAFEELFFLSLGFAQRRRQDAGQGPAKAITASKLVDERIRRRIPFDLTHGQNAALAEILADLRESRPMNRLLQGDVGVGKSAVAIYVLLATVAAHAQAVYMAPTGILAEQFAEVLRHYLQGSQVNVELLTGALTAAERARILDRTRAGEVHVLAGTHALLNEKLNFKDLRLVIIDEQHKFGVRQRLELHSKGYRPHLLTMTSTPIPRTLALTLYGDVALSRIAEAPAGRGKVETRLLTEADRVGLFEQIRREVKKGGQVYVVVPAIGEGAEAAVFDGEEFGDPPNNAAGRAGFAADGAAGASPRAKAARGRGGATRAASSSRPRSANAAASKSPGAGSPPDAVPGLPATVRTEGGLVSAERLAQHLANTVFPDLRVGLLHGQLSNEEKTQVMNAFRLRMIDVLVTTVVIEVGVDVPNASLMVIEQADRFGLSTLHQLRGRIGRGERHSLCAVFSDDRTDAGRERLTLFASTNDGFKIAEGDYQLRRSGRLFGTEQSGASEMIVADLVRDESLLQEAKADAERLLEQDPALRNVPAGLRAKLVKIFQHRLELGNI
ncbi:MAG: ATP-dependent DNA helicase RecG [Planctomycetota bacterium]